MKKLVSIFCTLVLTMTLLTVPALAKVDVKYSGRVDNFTGEPFDEKSTQVKSERVIINSTTTFDNRQKMFVYSAGGKEVYSSVASGISTTQPVRLTLPEGMVYTLYRDGSAVTDVDPTYIDQPGAYVLSESMSGGQSVEVLRFTVLYSVTGKLESFRVPDGFALSSVMRDGQEISHQVTSASLAEEGNYTINYRCVGAGLSYHETFAVDHTAPALALKEVKNGVAKGPVDVSDLEEDAKIGIWLNGESVPYTGTLTGSGVYRIVVSDEAGNQNDYQFTIQVYFNNSAMLLFLAVLLILLLVVGYILYSRKHLRVR